MIFLSLTWACAWRGPAPLQTVGDLQPTSSVLAMDEAMWKLVALQGQRAERTADGRLSVTLELRNLASALDLGVVVRLECRGQDGMLVGETSEMVVLPRAGSRLWTAQCVSPAADRFVVAVRTP